MNPSVPDVRLRFRLVPPQYSGSEAVVRVESNFEEGRRVLGAEGKMQEGKGGGTRWRRDTRGCKSRRAAERLKRTNQNFIEKANPQKTRKRASIEIPNPQKNSD